MLAIVQPVLNSRHTHQLVAQFIPIIRTKVAFVTPQISPNQLIEKDISLNQISATLASTWTTTDHSNTAITGCNCPQCQLTV